MLGQMEVEARANAQPATQHGYAFADTPAGRVRVTFDKFEGCPSEGGDHRYHLNNVELPRSRLTALCGPWGRT